MALGRRWRTFLAWHREEQFWREVYVRTFSTVLAGAVLAGLALVLGLIEPPSLRQALLGIAVTGIWWLAAQALALLVVLFVEAFRWLQRRSRREPPEED